MTKSVEILKHVDLEAMRVEMHRFQRPVKAAIVRFFSGLLPVTLGWRFLIAKGNGISALSRRGFEIVKIII